MKLDVREITVGYDGVPVVHDLDLHVDAGEAVCLVGPNGAGKSTALRGIIGLNRLSSGAVRLDGHDISGLQPSARARLGLGVVPEGRRIFPHLTVAENLAVAATVVHSRRQTDREVDAIFDRFTKLSERRDQMGGLLSGGEQQMLALARALIQKPTVLMIDELSLGLAPIVYEDLGELVRSLADDGLGVLLVEQNAMLAMRICDRGYLLSGGRVVLSGTIDEMRATDTMHDLYLGGMERTS